jgi:hypothetical protein
MKAQVKNWKTTLAGAVMAAVAALAEVSAGKPLDEWQTWIFPVSLAVIGFLARDADKSTEQSK